MTAVPEMNLKEDLGDLGSQVWWQGRDRIQPYVFCARVGDDVAARARARSIWAAQSAQATQNLGIDTCLVGGVKKLPFPALKPGFRAKSKRYLAKLYNIEADFDVRILHSNPVEKLLPEDHPLVTEHGEWEFRFEVPRTVLPFAKLVHTRDPRLAAQCLKAGIRVIYEDHDEEFQVAGRPEIAELFESPHAAAIVAITSEVASRLEEHGVPSQKILVADSGVNRRAFRYCRQRTNTWRKFLLEDRYKHLVSYSGGLQLERGIDQIMETARSSPDTMFAIMGGNKSDNHMWKSFTRSENITNVKYFGFVDQKDVCDIQKACDAVLYTRSHEGRPGVTSPLKMFEYLASGAPIVSAVIPALTHMKNKDLAITWYDPSDASSLGESLQRCFRDFPRREELYEQNRALAQQFTWEERQKKILTFADF
ncbi:glycosyltransferase [Roseibium aggregatum]|uniref:glycosyltransferase n=1 Tax=Roseibium aggregatum TaxID=187304 RepID=UPI003A976D2E